MHKYLGKTYKQEELLNGYYRVKFKNMSSLEENYALLEGEEKNAELQRLREQNSKL